MNRLSTDVKNARKCENINDPIDTHFLDYAAMACSRIFIKLRIIPNVITLLSGIVGVIGGLLLAFNTLWINIVGALCLIISVIFDTSDGQVARLTKKYSNLGRTLDGIADFLVYLSIHIALCIRLYPVNVPFTETPWGIFIIPVAVIACYFFLAQSRTVDYYKNLHMYILSGGKGGELSRTENIKRQITGCKKHSFERLRLKSYYSYTKTQESESPKAQKLLSEIEKHGNVFPEELVNTYMAKSRKYVKFTNLLTFNLRTIVLFILLFLPWRLESFYFPFVILILETVRITLIVKYEKLADSVYAQNFFENFSDSGIKEAV